MERIGNSSLKCSAPKMASKFANDISTNWILESRDKIGLRKRIGKSWSFSAKSAANGLKSAKVCLAAPRIRSRTAFTPTSKRTMISNLRNYRTLTRKTSKFKNNSGELFNQSTTKRNLQSNHTIYLS